MNQIQMAAKFYEAREAARFILGDTYGTRIEQWTRLVRRVMDAKQKPAMSACLELMQADDNPHAQLLLLAATVEVIERFPRPDYLEPRSPSPASGGRP